MKRRDFFAKLALAAPALFLPKALDAFHWKAAQKGWTFRTTGSGLYYCEFEMVIKPIEPIYDPVILGGRWDWKAPEWRPNPDWVSHELLLGPDAAEAG